MHGSGSIVVVFGTHIDPHADAIARIVRQRRGLAPAAVLVCDAVPVHSVFVCLLVPHFAALGVVRAGLGRHRVARVAALPGVVPNGRADDGTGDGGGTATIAAADLITDRRTDDAAQDHGAGRGSIGGIAARARHFHLLVTSLGPALALRRGDTHVAHDGVDVDHAGIVIVGRIAAAVRGALPLAWVGKCRLPAQQQAG